nr:hypothetical protein Iba_chr06bCG15600 [Ipomoea batatas]GMD07980.1 hypothetical protein Iba_chr06cCG12360 [Ipomoea batatas]GME08176.1 hypothetical protein Iba_scaffold7321CG0020 [Ipomoea batatas]
MVSKSFSLIFSLLLIISAFLCFTTTDATSRRLYAAVEEFSPKSDRQYTTLERALLRAPPAPESNVPGHGSPGGMSTAHLTY